MKIIALEEHFVTPEIRAAWNAVDAENRDDVAASFTDEIRTQLEDLAETRLQHMDETGVDVQVLSLTAPGVQNMEAAQAVSMAQACNDHAAEAVAAHPDRFQAFAALPTPDPAASVRELLRCIEELGFQGAMLHGRTRERMLDHPDFLPIFEAAASLRTPIYIHPQVPPRAVRNAYYDGFDPQLSRAFASSGWGWHMEAGIQAIRLILSGVFDRFPDLQIILGHWGEMVVFFLERLNDLSRQATTLQKPVEAYVRQNFYITPSGIFSDAYFRETIEVMGIDRMLFSTDYPFRFAPQGGARNFLEKAALSEADKAKIAHENWECLQAGHEERE